MEKEKKIRRKFAPFSNTPVNIKSAILVIMLLLAVLTIWGAMVRTILITQREKYRQMEHTVVTASEQIVNLSVESAVSIAQNIYTNEAIYDFLNKEYSSEAEYYAAYYPLQRNTVLNIAETNIVKSCTIYTSNPTILAGGAIKKLNTAVNDYWYKYFMEINKSTVLCIDQSKNEFILIRKLDYYTLDTGDCYLCLEMNSKVISEFADSLDFDGELYIMSGNHLLYSSDKDAATSENIAISQDFDCVTRNYYTVDIEFYARSHKKGFKDFVHVNKELMIILIGIMILSVIIGRMLAMGVKRRVKAAMAEYHALGIIQQTKKGRNGRDEVGMLLDICCDMSAKLQQKGYEYKKRGDTLMRKESDYASLFITAMRLDAELTMTEKYPYVLADSIEEDIPLVEEAKLVARIADILEKNFTSTPIPEDKWHIPAYSFALIADDIFNHYNDVSANFLVTENTAVISFESSETISNEDMLKFNAIFEEGEVCDDYSFNRNYRFNPYLRLKQCLGHRIELEIPFKDRLRLVFTIKTDIE